MQKTINIIKNVFVWLLVAVAFFMMVFTIVSVTTFDRNERSLFGYKAFIVRSNSMSATDFNAGDLILTKEVDPATLREGDIIAFISQGSENYGETVTHKIRRLDTDANGQPGFVTYGTTTDVDDDTLVTYPFVLGKYTVAIPKVGTFFYFLKTTPGYISCILLPFLLLILFQGANVMALSKQLREEEQKELEAEKAQLAEERRQAAEMMRELQLLREQMAQGGGQPPAGE